MTDDRLERARAQSLQLFEKRLAERVPRDRALDEALDAHYERVDRLDLDIDGEMDRVTKILKAHVVVQAPPPCAAPAPGTGREPPEERLLTSPYRFVALNETVVRPEDEVLECGLSTPLKGGFRGEITVTWAAETPLLIGGKRTDDHVVEPMRLGRDGPFVVPGATFRGALRAAMEIVASGRLSQINAHARYGLRDFDHPRVKPPGDETASLLSPDKVRAGWLRRIGKNDKDEHTYTIEPCAQWYTVAIADLPGHGDVDPLEWRLRWLKMEMAQRYATLRKDKAGKDTPIDFANHKAFTFALAGDDGQGAPVTPTASGGRQGRLVFSNRSPTAATLTVEKLQAEEGKRGSGQQKKREYVFVDDPKAKPFPVPDTAWKRFELINCKPGTNKLVPDGSWKVLEPSLKNPGARIPVFYIVGENDDPKAPKDEDGLEIGLTRFFKVAHRFSVGDMRDRVAAHKRERVAPGQSVPIDFVEALFGHVFEPKEVFAGTPATAPADLARKGRVACGFAFIPATQARITEPVATTQGAPRASFAPFYLKGRIKDYSSETGTTLAGRKRYLPRYPADRRPGAEADIARRLKDQITRLNRDFSDKTDTRLRFLAPREGERELVFEGKIRLNNVSAAEIGALLWVLTHGGDPTKPRRHMIGRAKPFGAGQLRVKALTFTPRPNDPDGERLRQSPQPWELPGATAEGWVSPQSWSLTPFLKAFHDHMVKRRPDWTRGRDLIEFLASCDPRLGAELSKPPPKDRMAYPMLKEFTKLRAPSKLSNKRGPPDDRRDRYLPVLDDAEANRHKAALILPYLRAPSKDRP